MTTTINTPVWTWDGIPVRVSRSGWGLSFGDPSESACHCLQMQGARQARSALAVDAPKVTPLRHGRAEAGFLWQSPHAKWAMLSGLCPQGGGKDRNLQLESLLDDLMEIVGYAGFQPRDIVRTWYYLENILDWYGEFNRIRTARYRDLGLLDRPPASTGIGAPPGCGKKVGMAALIVQPLDDQVVCRTVESSLQCPAPKYGSSFSRAMEITAPDGRFISISGTASIGADGKTTNVGDAAAQVVETFDCVESLLTASNMGWGDVVRGIAYMPSLRDEPMYLREAARRGLSIERAPLVEGVVCRDDLLFELEVEAWRPKSG